MKVVQINAVYDFGSTGIIVKDLHEQCVKNGIDCEVVYSVAQEKAPNTYHMGNFMSNKLHALMTRICGKQGYFSFFSTRRLLKHFNEYKPDIIHLHNLHGCFINVPMLLRYVTKKNIAVVVSLHDCWFFTGGCSHYSSVGCYKWKEQCGKCPRRYDDVAALLFDGTRQVLKDRVELFGAIKNLTAVGVSQWITDEAAQKVFKNNLCFTIHNGVDTSFFHPVESDFRKKHDLEGKFVILAPANKWFLDINKDTFEYFVSQLKDDMRMIFIGSGVVESRLTDKMINIGFVSSREEIRDIYSAVDVMVNCTREESLCLQNIEVQACGTPVITYSNTGVKETVDGTCGYAVENGNPQLLWKMTNKILTFHKDSYTSACCKWVSLKFDKQNNYQKYIELYKSIKLKTS